MSSTSAARRVSPTPARLRPVANVRGLRRGSPKRSFVALNAKAAGVSLGLLLSLLLLTVGILLPTV